MADAPFIKFYPADFLSGTSGLAPAERGIYITLLCLIYENDGPIRRDDERLSRRCGCRRTTFKKVLESLIDEGKIVERDGLLTNLRSQNEIHERRSRTANAKLAANKRWHKTPEKTQQNQYHDDAEAFAAHHDPHTERISARTANQKPESDRGGGGSAGARESLPSQNAEQPPDQTDRERLLVAMGHPPGGVTATGRIVGNNADMAEARRWSDELGLTLAEQLAVIQDAAPSGTPPNSFRYFTEPMQRAAGRKAEGPLKPLAGARAPPARITPRIVPQLPEEAENPWTFANRPSQTD